MTLIKKFWPCLLLGLMLSFSLYSQHSDSAQYKHPVFRKVAAPIALMSIGVVTWNEEKFINRDQLEENKNEHASFYSLHLDDYLQYVPAAMVYGLNVAGVRGKNSVMEETIMLLKSEILMIATVYTLKETTHIERPDNTDYKSFPSGHTAQAFVAATFLHKEYGEKSIWYSIGGYTVATSVGVMRVTGNHHWLSDVFFGAAIGILSTELVYATHQYKWSERKVKLTGLPVFNKGAYGVYLCMAL